MAADATGIREYKGAAKATTITAGITSGATSFSIADSTGWPTGAVGNFIGTADGGTSIEEKMLCSALAGGVITVVTRGYDNTAQVAHSSGCSFVHTVAAIDVAEGNYIANFDLTPAKTTPVDADVMPLKTSGVLHFVTWASIKATALTYFNTKFSRASFRTQATANSTLTLTVSDNEIQEFTGTTAGQVVQEADVTTLFIGYRRRISNKSTQSIAVNSSGGNLIYTVPAGTDWLFTCNAITGTTAASWSNSYAGASAAPSSKFVQLVNAVYSTETSNTTATLADTGLTATITPTSASNNVLVIIQQHYRFVTGSSSQGIEIHLLRGASDIKTLATRFLYFSIDGFLAVAYLDSPASTSALAYKVQHKVSSTTATSLAQVDNNQSTITLIEVAP